MTLFSGAPRGSHGGLPQQRGAVWDDLGEGTFRGEFPRGERG